MTTTNLLVPAAQYLRMSTEHQQYSLENQSTAIQKYADNDGFEVVRTYSDAAKSGLVLRSRAGLRQLLQDVVVGTAPYKTILVYDVSRWGRFQDTDESGHYEFLCKSDGVPVHYCAETFANDGTLPSLIMKALKRTMAGEYSRELGVKVLAGQKRLARLGFKQGGVPGYGLRRMLVSRQELASRNSQLVTMALSSLSKSAVSSVRAFA
jgi:DNA invertase Pin-like site-specific DNA recombinase